MTVADLIDLLKTFPQDLPVAYRLYSEQVMLTREDITTKMCQPERNDGWVHDARPDKPSVKYLMLPGN